LKLLFVEGALSHRYGHDLYEELKTKILKSDYTPITICNKKIYGGTEIYDDGNGLIFTKYTPETFRDKLGKKAEEIFLDHTIKNTTSLFCGAQLTFIIEYDDLTGSKIRRGQYMLNLIVELSVQNPEEQKEQKEQKELTEPTEPIEPPSYNDNGLVSDNQESNLPPPYSQLGNPIIPDDGMTN